VRTPKITGMLALCASLAMPFEHSPAT